MDYYAAIEALEWLSGEELMEFSPLGRPPPSPSSLSSISRIVRDTDLPPTRQRILNKMATDENSTTSDESLAAFTLLRCTHTCEGLQSRAEDDKPQTETPNDGRRGRC